MLKIGFIGAGGIANSHRAGLAQLEGARLTGVHDIRAEAAEKAAAESGAKVFPTAESLIDASDAVYILTPPHTHREFALKAMAAGKHVLCEKPLATRLEDGYAMRDAWENSGVKFMTAFSMRFRPSYQAMKAICDSGKLGRPLTFWFQRMFGGGSYNPNNWRYRPESRCGMSIESLSHQIDLIRWMLAEIDSVYARVIASFPELPDVDNNIHILFNLSNGAVATLHVSWTAHLAFNTTGINGTKGTVRIWGEGSANHDRLQCKLDEPDEEQVIELNEVYGPDIFANESRHFLECILADRTPFTGLRDGLRALEISHAILQSSRENRVIYASEYL